MPEVLVFDQWETVTSAGVLKLFLYTGMSVFRVEGGLLLMAYAGRPGGEMYRLHLSAFASTCDAWWIS